MQVKVHGKPIYIWLLKKVVDKRTAPGKQKPAQTIEIYMPCLLTAIRSLVLVFIEFPGSYYIISTVYIIID